MENVEQFVHGLLRDRVRLKNIVKWVYQFVFSSLPGSRKETSLPLEERRRAFFGFHDKSPWSSDGTVLLGHTFEGEGVGDRWKEGEPVGISIFTGPNWTERIPVAQTRAWNWQQGAQLQWVGSGRRIVYNDFRNGACVGVVRDVEAGEETLLEHPVAAVSAEGSRYASICFETFGRAMPAYGYAFGPTASASTVAPCELIVRDLSGGPQVTVSLEDLQSQLTPRPASEVVDFFSHCLFSPNETKLLFLRRQARPNRRLRSELFCVDLEQGHVRRMQFGDMVSHFTWLSNDNALAFANTEQDGDGFYIADTETGAVSTATSRFNNRDGHPHATPNGDRVVFDTYPDRRRYQRLFLWEKGAGRSRVLATLYSPMKFWGPSRADLHPRLREDGAYVSFDASFSGTRSLVTARLPSHLSSSDP